MKKLFKRSLAAIMVVLMILPSVPLSRFIGIDMNGLDFGVSASASDLPASGSCGENVTYTYNSTTKELIISGTGEMENYLHSLSPFFNNDIESVTVKSGVTTIGNSAFWRCNKLTNVTIPDSVTTIGDEGFSGCDNLTSVTIPDSVTTIGDSAFSDCAKLTSVTIPDSVTTIGDSAFSGCDSLTSVTIPDSVTTIGNSAFSDCDSLTSVTIPDSVTIIGNEAFSSCNSLTKIMVDRNNSYYNSDENGVLFDKNKTKLIQFPIGNVRTEYTIPDSVITINDSAFSGCDSLTNIAIPDSVTTIGNTAFSSCDSLTNVTISDCVTTIGFSAFQGCSSLTSVTIGNSVTTIGFSAFQGCSSLTSVTIGNSATTIGFSAFEGCSSLTSITIPNSVTTIDTFAFYGCSSLTNVTIGNSVTTIGFSAFEGCSSLTSITIPNSVTIIDEYAFCYCDSLTSVTIPDSVTTIGENAFYGYDSLTDIYFYGTQEQWNNISIGEYNDSLKNATIHYNSSESFSEFKYHQTHVIDNYQTQNNKYESEYFSNKAVAMDGSDETSDLCIPGLTKEDNLVPQGITYYPEKNWILISAYSKNENTPSVIFALDKLTGDYVAEFEIYKSSGVPFTGHLGGIAASSNNLYLTNGKKISYIPLSEFDVEKGTSKIVAIEDSYTTYLGSDGASISYLSITDGVLYTGNFYNESEDYNTPANPYFNSIVFGYEMSGSNSTEEWNNYISSAKTPDVEFYIPDDINEIQCATVKDRKLYLSASYGRTNDSRLYIADVSTVQQQTFDYVDMEYTGLPMMEGMTFINDDLYAIFESGAYFYREKDASNKAKNPTDVIWKIRVPETNIYNIGEETYSFDNFGDFHSKGGHCFGMSITSAGYYNKELDVSDVGLKAINAVYSLNKTSTVTKSICYYQDIQGSYALGATVAGGSYYKYETYDIESDWANVVNYIKNHEYDNKGSLQIGFRKNGEGGHAINFLRYEEVNGEARIYAYDNNFPDTETYFYEASNGNILQAPYSTFSGAIDCIALRSVEKYYDTVGGYDSRKTWFSDKDKISISSTNVYPIDGNIEMGERVVFELAEDVETIIITPLVDNATFTYMNTEYSFSDIDEDTYAEFTFAETESDIPEFEIINAPHEHVYNETKTAPTCTEKGFTTYTCACGDTYVSDYVDAVEHKDADSDEFCDYCDKFLGTKEEENNCAHLCHKTGFLGFIWKIINFFQKLFGTNPVCECGMAHY